MQAGIPKDIGTPKRLPHTPLMSRQLFYVDDSRNIDRCGLIHEFLKQGADLTIF